MPNQTHRQKFFRAVFALPPQPNDALQYYSILRQGYRSVSFLNTKCTVGIHRMYCQSICAEKNVVNTEFDAWRKRTIMAMTVVWIHVLYTWPSWPRISLLRPSPEIWRLWPCSHALHGWMPAINKPPTKCVKLKMTPPPLHALYA